MRLIPVAAAALIATLSATVSLAADPAPAAPPATAAPATRMTTADTSIGDLLDNAAARAVLDKHAPGFTKNEQIDMARGMTLKAIQQYAPDQFSDAVLAKIDADLAQIPAGK
jgi:type IV secretory pathway VirJ component